MTLKVNFSVFLLSLALVHGVAANDDDDGNSTLVSKTGKALSVFQVVKFPNTACSGTGATSYNGTCYTASECTAKGGTSSGTCANSFGVCCTFTLGCGDSSSQNCTYFVSSNTPAAGSCGVKICKSTTDVCQLRIDFNTFVIAGPNTVTTSTMYEMNGAVMGNPVIPVTTASRCQTDTFTITGGSASTPPVICGTNTDQHMYVDASDACNNLNFQLGQSGVGTTLPTRQWTMKISQISCADANSAPSGCTQYYYGTTTGTVQSFNYANSYQLASQKQTICIRRERNYCRICWSAPTDTDFAVSGLAASGFVGGTKCCGYGSAGTSSARGFDCVMIPGASKNTANKNPAPVSICGKNHGLVISSSTNAATVCSMQLPFQLSFISDSFNYPAQGTKGFKLTYWQTTC